MDEIRVVARITARPETIEQTRALCLRLAEASRRESGCRSYDVLQDAADPAAFTLVEAWENTAALDAHNTTPHVAQALAEASSLLAKRPDIWRCRRVG